MKILKKYLLTLLLMMVALTILVSLNTHFDHNISTQQRHINQLKKPIYLDKKQYLTGNKTIYMGNLRLFNANEDNQIKFANHFLTNHFSYDDANTYANNRNQSHKRMTKELWKKLKNTEFSTQTNRIGKSLISANRSTSNFISATPFIQSSTLPQAHMNDENIPIYYLVTSSYTNNSNNSSNIGKASTLIKMQVDSDKHLVSNYQVLDKVNHS